MRLSVHDIHIWQVSLTQSTDTAQIIEALSLNEREKVKKFRSQQLKQSFLVTRFAVRYLLAKYLGLEPSALQFGQGEFGKPFLFNAPALAFNLSHSVDSLYLAVAGSGEVGIDIESANRKVNIDHLAARFFSPKEAAILTACHDLQRKQQLFFQLWTAKEAFVKGIGVGLQYGLDQFCINIDQSGAALQLECESRYQGWQLKALSVPLPYYGTLAFTVAKPQIHYFEMDLAKV